MSRVFGLIALVASTNLLIAPAPAHAHPVVKFVSGYLGGKILDGLFDPATGRLETEQLKQRLRELEQSAVLRGEMKEEVRKLRGRIDKQMTREEFRREARKIAKSMSAVHQRLDELEHRVEKLEVENQDLKNKTRNATDAEFFRKRGDRFAAGRKHRRALANYSLALKLNPALSGAHIGRVKVYRAMQEWGVVAAAAHEAIRQPRIKNSGWFFVERGRALINLGEYDSAMSDLSHALKLRYTYAHVYYLRGAVYMNKGEWQRAIADFNRSIEEDPKDADVFVVRGQAFKRLGKLGPALADVSEAIRLDPKCAEAYRVRGIIHSRQGRHDKGIADLDRLIRLSPDDSMAYSSRGFVYLQKGDYTRAIADCTKAIRLNPNNAVAYNNRGVAYEKLGNLKQAHEDVNESRRLKRRQMSAR